MVPSSGTKTAEWESSLLALSNQRHLAAYPAMAYNAGTGEMVPRKGNVVNSTKRGAFLEFQRFNSRSAGPELERNGYRFFTPQLCSPRVY